MPDSQQPPSITCILPAFNEAANLQILIPQLSEYLPRLSARFEILVVDDGSRDNTVEAVRTLAQAYPVSLLCLSRNFGKEAAMSAGLDHAEGDVVILMDSDLQHPIEMLEVFFQHWQQGYEMVYGVRADRSDEGRLKRSVTNQFYRLLSQSADVSIEPNAGDFRLMDKKVVRALRSLPERKRMMKGLFAWVGFRSIGVPFKVNPRFSGQTSFGLRRLSSLALTGITAFSSAPLRIWMVIGACISFLAFAYAMTIILSTLILGTRVPGWPTLIASISFLGGIQLLSVGVLGEYIARIFSEVKGRPVYLISDYERHADQSSPAAQVATDSPQTPAQAATPATSQTSTDTPE